MPPRAWGLLCHCLYVTQDAQSTCALTAMCSARLPVSRDSSWACAGGATSHRRVSNYMERRVGPLTRTCPLRCSRVKCTHNEMHLHCGVPSVFEVP